MQSLVAMCAGTRFKSLQLSVSAAAVVRSLVRWLGLLVAINRSQAGLHSGKTLARSALIASPAEQLRNLLAYGSKGRTLAFNTNQCSCA